MKQNITLSLEKELLKKAKLLAARKDMSVTKLLTEQLAKVVSEDDQYEAAKKRTLTLLRKGLHLEGISSPSGKNFMKGSEKIMRKDKDAR